MHRSLVALAAASVASGVLLVACPLTIDEGRIAANADNDSSAGDAGDGGEAGCPSGMVRVPSPSSGPWFCVDALETTNASYKAFIAAADPPQGGSQISECAWNSTFVPVGWTGTEAPDHPVGALDWCDAFAYCKWAGKRLCGAIGGGALDYKGGAGDLAVSQWFNACSRGGTKAYPYGSSYDPQACVSEPYDAGGSAKPIAVGHAAGCEGGYPGLFDMSGNVAEFIDSCSTTPEAACDGGGPGCDLCLLMGGSFLSGGSGGSDIACQYANQIYRHAPYVDNGVRCCADLP
jgi:formylglycine-generating enzyme required for sulfatase activity